jgi:hypothetical protein
VVATCLIVFGTGCSSAGGIAPSVPVAAAQAVAMSGGAATTQSVAQTAGLTTEMMPAAAIAPAAERSPERHLYVTNAGSNTITIYDKMARGNVAPVRTIGGPNTGLTCPKQAAVDARGYVYVAVSSALPKPYGYCNDSGGGEILVFAPGANGDVAPVRTISGPATQIVNAGAVAVADDGTLFVGSSQFVLDGANSTILAFAAGASGDVAPIRASAPLDDEEIDGITLDPTLGLVTSSEPGSTSVVAEKIGYYARDLKSGGPAIACDDPGPLASDPATRSYLGVSAFGGRIDRFADGTTGAYACPGGGTRLQPGLISSLLVASCPSAVTIGPEREVYVAGTCPDSVSVYGPKASGTAAALRVIAGPLTQLSNPIRIAVGP